MLLSHAFVMLCRYFRFAEITVLIILKCSVMPFLKILKLNKIMVYIYLCIFIASFLLTDYFRILNFSCI